MRDIGSLRPSTLTWVVAATMVVLSLAPPAWCAGTDEATASQAKRHYEEGTKAFNLGEFARAIAEFKATYNVKPDPLLLFNIAQSYRLAGDPNQALFFYKSFLRNMPAATNRKDVEAQIRKLEKQIEEQKREGAAPPPAAAVVVPPPPAPAAASPVNPAPESATGRTTAATAAPPRPAATHPAARAPLPAAPAPAPAPTTAAQVDLTTQPPAPEPDSDRPFYKRWWFWAGAGAVVIIVGGVAAASAKKSPNTTFGTFDPQWIPAP